MDKVLSVESCISYYLLLCGNGYHCSCYNRLIDCSREFSIDQLQNKYQIKLMVVQDRRLKAITEALTNMKVLKLYAWETHFKNVVQGLRKEEFKWIHRVLTQKEYYRAQIRMIPELSGIFIESKVPFSQIVKFLKAQEL
ncbi:hypothetical protein EZV62_002280 [Acer yangbiense]|uniref:Uncharacterized protein n=1 Tax=Acer yangbiense TaxID=1000413 RepID=A0A5C7IWN6_9ROSI|nr:hypothetical protein EZV62_002280 [Acer yangbiense]